MQNEFLTRIKPYLDSYTKLVPVTTDTKSQLRQLANVKAVVFDIYGTLIISSSGDLDKSNVSIDSLTTALNEGGVQWKNEKNIDYAGSELLKEFHLSVDNQHKLLKEKGYPYPEIDILNVWDIIIKKGLDNDWIYVENTIDLKTITVVFEILCNRVWPMPGMSEIVAAFQKKNIPLGIVSNAQFYTPVIMNYFFNKTLSEQENIEGFDHNISVYSYKLSRSKPDVYLFEQLKINIKNNYGLNPEDVLFVGNDMLKDVWTASEVGFKTALFAGDKRSLRLRADDERCNNLYPDIVISDLLELAEVIKL